MTDTPVLLMAWRRPDLTKEVLNQVRAAAPPALFVALDGPRPGDEQACADVESLVRGSVDWTCHLEILKRENNLGCRLAVSEAIDWFFDNVDRGIILEDDTVPDSSFFEYCEELLERYADDRRVGMVSGVNLLGAWPTAGPDYFFGHGGIWGWATWRNRWALADIGMKAWKNAEARQRARAFLGGRDWAANERLFERTCRGEIDTWDYQWSFARASHQWLSTIPATNLVRNVGFSPSATHTRDRDSPLASLPTGRVAPPLTHPETVSFDRGYQAAVRRLEHPGLVRRTIRRAKRQVGVS